VSSIAPQRSPLPVRPTPWTRCLLALLVSVLLAGRAIAQEDVPVPSSVQAGILARVVAYQRNLKAAQTGVVRVLILTRAGGTESQRAAHQFARALGDLKAMVGRPHEELIEPFVDGHTLAETCRTKNISIVYVTPGLGDRVGAIAHALKDSTVLSVSPVPGFVPRGVVVGFDLVGGKPQLLVNRTQMNAQGVHLSPALLKVMQVYE
jgi:hypothetical protein